MVYDITNPQAPTFIEYFNNIDYAKEPGAAGDLAPEGTKVFTQDGKTYLVAGNELSSTISMYELATDGKMSFVDSLKMGDIDQGASEIVAYDPESKKVFSINSQYKRVDVVDVSDPSDMKLVDMINVGYDGLQSVSVKNGLVAIAVSGTEFH